MQKGLGVLVLFLATIAGGLFWWHWASGAAAPKSKIEQSIFIVKKGEGISSIGERLQKEGLVRSSLAFKILIWKEGLEKRIQAGDFRLNAGMTPLEIGKELTHGTLDVWLTIIEGWRREEIGQEINSKFKAFDPSSGRGFQSSKFDEEAKDKEGYLFPDTYLIPKEATAGAIVKILLRNFEAKFNDALRERAAQQGLSTSEVLILASIIEREAKSETDRPMVAGILIKRWKNGWPLQADATVQYAVASRKCLGKASEVAKEKCDWWPEVLTSEDLKIDSPFNTRLYQGLPPAPICNPSLSAIKAVLYPITTDYWFYLSDMSGKMHYAKTNEEHTANIGRYLSR